jgi:LPXTG-motif cell wall-anchored protein
MRGWWGRIPVWRRVAIPVLIVFSGLAVANLVILLTTGDEWLPWLPIAGGVLAVVVIVFLFRGQQRRNREQD